MEKEKKSLTEIINEHPKLVFWTRFVLWTLLACVLPVVFIAWRFELFNPSNRISLGGWGIVAIVIVVIFIIVLASYLRNGMNKSNVLLVQCISGFVKLVLPLLVFLGILYVLRNSIDRMMQALGCTILCELIALPVNPMPQWVLEQQKDVREEERKGTIDYFVDKFFSKKKDD